MALSTATATLYDFPKGVDNTQRTQTLRGTIALSFGTYPPGGYSINWAALSNSGGGRTEAIPLSGSTIIPVESDVQGTGNPPKGYQFIVDTVVGNLHVFVADGTSGASGPLVEGVGPNSNVPADLANEVISFSVKFVRN